MVSDVNLHPYRLAVKGDMGAGVGVGRKYSRRALRQDAADGGGGEDSSGGDGSSVAGEGESSDAGDGYGAEDEDEDESIVSIAAKVARGLAPIPGSGEIFVHKNNARLYGRDDAQPGALIGRQGLTTIP